MGVNVPLMLMRDQFAVGKTGCKC